MVSLKSIVLGAAGALALATAGEASEGGGATACRPLPAGCRCQIRAESERVNATIAAVNSEMNGLTGVVSAQRALVRTARQAATAACDLDDLKAALAAAQKAAQEAQQCVGPAAAAFAAAQKKFNDLTTPCAGHANEEPCKDELSDAFAAMRAAGFAVARCQQADNAGATALTAAQVALAAQTLKCAASQSAVQSAERAERRAVRGQQAKVNGTFTDEQAATAGYLETLTQCGTQNTNGTEVPSLMHMHTSLVQRMLTGLSAHFE